MIKKITQSLNMDVLKTLVFILLSFSNIIIQQTSSSCTFPDSLNGTWVSSDDGTWIINSTHILNYKTERTNPPGDPISARSGAHTLNFECYENRNDTKYVLKSEGFQLFAGIVSVYTCIDIRKISAIKLLYYHVKDPDPSSGLRFTVNNTYEGVCTIDNYEQPYSYLVALKSGSESKALITCPSSVFGSYNYDTCTDVNSNDTSLDVCDSRQQFILNYTLCNTTQLFSMDGVLDCVYFTTNGTVSYLTLYNRDSTEPDKIDYFRYVCLAVELKENNVSLTANPNKCNADQNSSSIDNPGVAMKLSPYYLCPILTDEGSSFNILPIILGILGGLLLLLLLALIIYCCCKRRCKKKKTDEEEVLSDSDDSDNEEEEQKKKSDSRRSSRQSSDSGISEPPMSGRNDIKEDNDSGIKSPEQDTVLILTSEGEKEFDDKASRPCSGEEGNPDRSRMSDLPPSTIPTEDDQLLSHRSEEEPKGEQIETDATEEEKENAQEDQLHQETVETKEESDSESSISSHEHQETVETKEESDSESSKSSKENDETVEQDNDQENSQDKEETPSDESEKEIEEPKEQVGSQIIQVQPTEREEDGGDNTEKTETDQENMEENNHENQQADSDNDSVEHRSEIGEDIYVKEKQGEENKQDLDDQQKLVDKSDTEQDAGEQETEKKSKSGEQSDEEAEEKEHKRLDGQHSSDDEQRYHTLIGGRKGKHYVAGEGLTKVLVSREEEEKRHLKLHGKSKKQKMRKFAKRKTRKIGGKDGKGKAGKADSDDELNTSDEEARIRGYAEAPFMKQYENKKHIEHILDEQHYWSDPEAEKDELRRNDNMSSIFSSSDSSSEEEIIGPDGLPIRVKKSKRKKRGGDGDDISNADSEYLRQKMLKRAGSFDSLVSIEDTKNIDKRKSKRRLNQHDLKTDSDEEMEKERSNDGKREANKEELNKNQESDRNGDDVNRTKTILVKEHSDMSTDSIYGINGEEGDQKHKSGTKSERRRKHADGKSGEDMINDMNGTTGEERNQTPKDGRRKERRRGDGDEGSEGVNLSGFYGMNGEDDDQNLKDGRRKDRRRIGAYGMEGDGDKDGEDLINGINGITGEEGDRKHKDGRSKERRGGKGVEGAKGGRRFGINGGDGENDDKFPQDGRRKDRRRLGAYGIDGEDLSDFCDTDLDKLSDRDSGLDDAEGDVDVVLTEDQQQMIVNMLFDEDMNLRPQFCRDANGRIVRLLDGTVIYDPHTGRFTFRKRLGRIFKVPRLKRNDKGRPLGGYIEDEYGPKTDEKSIRRKSSSAGRPQSGTSKTRSRETKSSAADLKRVRSGGQGRNVGFDVPDEENVTIPDGEAEFSKRGRRDIGSAIRRTLNKRLFKKKRKRTDEVLPDIKVRRAWGEEFPGSSHNHFAGPGVVTPLSNRSGKFQQSSPWNQRKTPATGDSDQWQMYREGLQSDRKILESLQGKINQNEKPFSPREAFVDTNGDMHDDPNAPGYNRGYSYVSGDGRLAIRERGCPELQPPKQRLFTIVRRPEDLETSDHIHQGPEERNVKSAPMQIQEYSGDHFDSDQTLASRHKSDNSLAARSADGRYSMMSSIDDNRLRRLLEELYKDKKYFDRYVETTEPKSEAFIHSQGLAEHGRGYLLKRADYWEKRGPLPPRPPMTEVGWKMQREMTLAASRQASGLNSTMTCTPDISTQNMPGLIESPRENERDKKSNESNETLNDSIV